MDWARRFIKSVIAAGQATGTNCFFEMFCAVLGICMKRSAVEAPWGWSWRSPVNKISSQVSEKSSLVLSMAANCKMMDVPALI